MRKDLDEALCAKYPLIFRDRHGDMRTTLMCWGFDVGDGWYNLIEATCALLYQPYADAQRNYTYQRSNEGTPPYKCSDVITAVDVERARLEMAERADEVPVAVQVKEKFGTLRFSVSGGSEQDDAYITFAEYFSGRVCEECGAPGQLRGGGWLRTLCDVHAVSNGANDE